MTRRALLIATGRYQHRDLPNLHCAKQNLSQLGRVLRDPRRGGFAVVTEVLDKRADDVRAALDDFLIGSGRPDDELLIYILGHGISRAKKYYLAASNTNPDAPAAVSISGEFIREQLAASRARSIVLLVDTCFSGMIAGLGADSDHDSELAEGFNTAVMHGISAYDHVKDRINGNLRQREVFRAILTAANSIQTADAGPSGGMSVFTDKVVSGLRGEAAARDGQRILFDDLANHVIYRLEHETAPQQPQRMIMGDQRHFVLSHRPPPVPASEPASEPIAQPVTVTTTHSPPPKPTSTTTTAARPSAQTSPAPTPALPAPPPPAGEQRRVRHVLRRHRRHLALTLAVLLTGAAALLWTRPWAAPASETWTRTAADQNGDPNGQCVGVSDGTTSFVPPSTSPTESGLFAAVKDLNSSTSAPNGTDASGYPAVTLVVASSFTKINTPCHPPQPLSGANGATPSCAGGPGAAQPAKDDPYVANDANVSGAITELRGVIAAVCLHNRTYGEQPQIHLLIANVGASFLYAKDVAQTIATTPTHAPLAAVIGLNESSQQTQDAIAALAEHNIPILASSASADAFVVNPKDNTRVYRQYFRTDSNNARAADILTQFVSGAHSNRFGQVLDKQRPCIIAAKLPDSYSVNLADDLRQRWAASHNGDKPPIQQYTPSSVYTELANSQTCREPQPGSTTPPFDAVLYTGRTHDLQHVLQAMDSLGYPPTVPLVAGDDLTELDANPHELDNLGGMTRPIYYSDIGFTDLTDYRNREPGKKLDPFVRAITPIIGTTIPLTGHMMLAFDSAWVMGETLSAVNQRGDEYKLFTGGGKPLWNAIIDQLDHTCGDKSILASTGRISFDRNGAPMSKLVVIQHRDPGDGTLSTVYVNGAFTPEDLRTYMLNNDPHDPRCQLP
jgi:hypothetical protein